MLIEEAPKYGNDNDYVDNLVVEAYDSYLDEIKKYPNTRYQRGPIGGIRYGGTSSISANVGQGMGTIATPDGRNAFEPLAEGCSPASRPFSTWISLALYSWSVAVSAFVLVMISSAISFLPFVHFCVCFFKL